MPRRVEINTCFRIAVYCCARQGQSGWHPSFEEAGGPALQERLAATCIRAIRQPGCVRLSFERGMLVRHGGYLAFGITLSLAWELIERQLEALLFPPECPP